MALAWLGRGTYDIGEWREALSEARTEHNKRTAEYLSGSPSSAIIWTRAWQPSARIAMPFDEGRT